MSKTISYIRVSTNKQDLQNQQHQILNYTNSKKMGSVEFIEVEVSSRKKDEDRKINDLFDSLKEDDTLVVVELSRIGRSVINVLEIVNKLIDKKVNLHIIKENMIIEPNNINPFTTFQINIFSSFGQLERDLISQRTKHSLQVKKQQGVKLGRQKGQQVKSIFDEHREKIVELIDLGVTQKKIVEYINVGTEQSLGKYIKSRGLKTTLSSSSGYIRIDYNLNILDNKKKKIQPLINKYRLQIQHKLKKLIDSHTDIIYKDIDFTKETYEVSITKDSINVINNQNPMESRVLEKVVDFLGSTKNKEIDTSNLQFIEPTSETFDEFGFDEIE